MTNDKYTPVILSEAKDLFDVMHKERTKYGKAGS